MRRTCLAERRELAVEGRAADSHSCNDITNRDCLSSVLCDVTRTTITFGGTPYLEAPQPRRHFPNVEDSKDPTGTECGPKSGHRVESLQSLALCAHKRHTTYKRTQGKGSARTAIWRKTFEGPHRASRYVPWGRVYLCSIAAQVLNSSDCYWHWREKTKGRTQHSGQTWLAELCLIARPWTWEQVRWL